MFYLRIFVDFKFHYDAASSTVFLVFEISETMNFQYNQRLPIH